MIRSKVEEKKKSATRSARGRSAWSSKTAAKKAEVLARLAAGRKARGKR
jgi:predicted Fe-S protein YdhL (DUF1289 family)